VDPRSDGCPRGGAEIGPLSRYPGSVPVLLAPRWGTSLKGSAGILRAYGTEKVLGRNVAD